MKHSVFSAKQRRELSTIQKYLASPDNELNNLGLQMFRKSKTFRQLKTKSLFYKDCFGKSVRVSRIIAHASKEVKNNKRINPLCLAVFSGLLSANSSNYFQRVFINTAEIL